MSGTTEGLKNTAFVEAANAVLIRESAKRSIAQARSLDELKAALLTLGQVRVKSDNELSGITEKQKQSFSGENQAGHIQLLQNNWDELFVHPLNKQVSTQGSEIVIAYLRSERAFTNLDQMFVGRGITSALDIRKRAVEIILKDLTLGLEMKHGVPRFSH